MTAALNNVFIGLGTHGTCKSFADCIQKDGFRVTSGLRGDGAYFWAYTIEELKEHSKKLAISWWHFANRQGKYSGQKEKSCAVVFANIKTDMSQYLDLEDLRTRQRFIVYYESIKDKIIAPPHEKMAAAYNMFVEDLEGKSNLKFSTVHVRVQKPKRHEEITPQDITGQPSCYVVRETQHITVDNVEVYENE